MAPDSETEQSEMPDRTHTEPSDNFDAKKLMKEYDDGRWMEDPAKIRGSILQWAKSDSMVLTSNDEPTTKELYLAWDYWMSGKLSHSWLLLKTRGDDKERFYPIFVDYLDSNEKAKEMVKSRAEVVDSSGEVERYLHDHLKSGLDVDIVSTEEKDENDEAVHHVERTGRDAKLKYQVDLSPSEVPRAGVDIEGEELIGYVVVGYYTVEGIPCFLLEDGEDTYEVPLHYLAQDDN